MLLSNVLVSNSSVLNNGLTIGCPADNQTEKVGCPHSKSDIQNIFYVPKLSFKTWKPYSLVNQCFRTTTLTFL